MKAIEDLRAHAYHVISNLTAACLSTNTKESPTVRRALTDLKGT